MMKILIDDGLSRCFYCLKPVIDSRPYHNKCFTYVKRFQARINFDLSMCIEKRDPYCNKNYNYKKPFIKHMWKYHSIKVKYAKIVVPIKRFDYFGQASHYENKSRIKIGFSKFRKLEDFFIK